MITAETLKYPICWGAVSYALPRLIEKASTSPENNSPHICNRFRHFLALLAQQLQQAGGRKWSFLTAVILDNSWISIFAISLLVQMSDKKWDSQKYLPALLLLLSGSSLLWVARKKLTDELPALSWIKPKPLE